MNASDKGFLAKEIAATSPADIQVCNLLATDATASRRALEEFRRFVAAKGDYLVIVLRR